MIMGRSYKMLANKKRGPPDEKWGALPPGVIQNVCFWADEAADGPKHKLMEVCLHITVSVACCGAPDPILYRPDTAASRHLLWCG